MLEAIAGSLCNSALVAPVDASTRVAGLAPGAVGGRLSKLMLIGYAGVSAIGTSPCSGLHWSKQVRKDSQRANVGCGFGPLRRLE